MKTFVPLNKLILKISFFLILLISTTPAFSQIIPELVFTNAVLESGTAGEDGAKYRFSDIATGYDAVVEIKGRSSSSVVLSSIDTSGTGLGYVKAFQPVLGIPGTAPANSNWSMDFRLIFYKAGTNKKVKISQFYVTGLDIDGDNTTLSEWAQMNKVTSIDSAAINSLTFTKLSSSGDGDDYKVEGIIANAPGIDTNATNVIATYLYNDKDGFDFTIGAKTADLTSSAAMRLNSIWFRDFTEPVLPVKLISFTASLANSKVDLKWATATEINASHFAIEKSFDGINFNDAGIVVANGNTTDEMYYNFTDNVNEDRTTVIYYRLRSVDMDGKIEYSSTRMIRISNESTDKIRILTYPNPVIKELRITISANWQNKKVLYELYQANGQVAKRTETASASQTEMMNISSLNAGVLHRKSKL